MGNFKFHEQVVYELHIRFSPIGMAMNGQKLWLHFAEQKTNNIKHLFGTRRVLPKDR